LPQVSGPDILLIDFSPDKRAAHRLARLLRDRGLAVARDIIKRDLAGSLDYARASAIRRAVILGSAEQPPETVLILDLATETRRSLPFEAFVQAVAQGESPWVI
ncbi:MAG: ATP phosphoribosyltransferase regulatory subunit, partial [candidate division NC10 bacterium]|nr:ATP phosphoribosyltransferase regulatory subunit [candidate division NC10 bacterium]